MDISSNEILDALRAANVSENAEGAYTAGEIADAINSCRARTCRLLNKLKGQGQIEVVRVNRVALDGRPSSVPAYRFIAPKKVLKRA